MSEQVSKTYESEVKIRPRSIRSSSKHHPHQHSSGVEEADLLPYSRRRRSERQLAESRFRWSVIVAVLEAKLISAEENERKSDSRGREELGQVAEQFNLSDTTTINTTINIINTTTINTINIVITTINIIITTINIIITTTIIIINTITIIINTINITITVAIFKSEEKPGDREARRLFTVLCFILIVK
jgi:hypothetical protein